jgi:predicted Zn-dependent peptidase
MAKQHCESWEPAETASRNTPESTGQGGYRAVERADDQQQTMVLVGAAPSLEDPLRYAAGLLATALGDASGSRLYWEIVHPGHAEMCDLSYQEYNHAGAYFLFLGCDPDNSEANLDRVSHVLHRIRETGLNQSEIDRARNKTLSRAMIRAERPMGRLMPLGGYYTYFNRYVSLDEDVTAYQSVTVDHVRQVLDRYPLRPLTLSTVGPRTDLKIVD